MMKTFGAVAALGEKKGGGDYRGRCDSVTERVARKRSWHESVQRIALRAHSTAHDIAGHHHASRPYVHLDGGQGAKIVTHASIQQKHSLLVK